MRVSREMIFCIIISYGISNGKNSTFSLCAWNTLRATFIIMVVCVVPDNIVNINMTKFTKQVEIFTP